MITRKGNGPLIEGLKFEFSGEQLKKQFEKRAEHHAKRVAFFEKQIASFKDEAADAEIRQGQNSFVRTKDAMEEQLRRHEKAVPLFRLLADHVNPKESYLLAIADMQVAEFLGQDNYSVY